MKQSMLFYNDNATFFDVVALRQAATKTIESLSLIQRAGDGQVNAAQALHVGFWPFVKEFEIAIDKRRLPRTPLKQKFDPEGDSQTVNATFRALRDSLAEMRQEEGSHAKHWIKDAECLKIPTLDGPLLPGVQRLIETAYVKNLPQFFALLAGTEFIAEELSAYLTSRKPFTDLFSRKRWIWGEVHLMPHDHGPSHLEIDLDLARAYATEDASTKHFLQEEVLSVIKLFGQAADEVEECLAPKQQSRSNFLLNEEISSPA